MTKLIIDPYDGPGAPIVSVSASRQDQEWWKRADGSEISPLWGLTAFDQPPCSRNERRGIRSLIRWAALVAVLAGMVIAAIALTPPCRPGDRGLYIGGAMLVAGCPR